MQGSLYWPTLRSLSCNNMVDYILKYRTENLIILYCYMYSRLSNNTRNVIWSFIKLMRNIRSDSWVDEFGIECDLY